MAHLRREALALQSLPLSLAGMDPAQAELALTLSWEAGTQALGLSLANARGDSLIIGYRPSEEKLYIDRRGLVWPTSGRILRACTVRR